MNHCELQGNSLMAVYYFLLDAENYCRTTRIEGLCCITRPGCGNHDSCDARLTDKCLMSRWPRNTATYLPGSPQIAPILLPDLISLLHRDGHLRMSCQNSWQRPVFFWRSTFPVSANHREGAMLSTDFIDWGKEYGL
jgi:hypothetical protein